MAEFNPELNNHRKYNQKIALNGKSIDHNNCMKCQYFEVTWDEYAPKGCSYFQFKGKLLPSVQLQKITGNKVCMAFKEKI